MSESDEAATRVPLTAVYRQLDDHTCADDASYDTAAGMQRLLTWMTASGYTAPDPALGGYDPTRIAGVTESRQKCLPTYLVIDASASMARHEATLNSALRMLHAKLAGSPRVSEFVLMSLIVFSSDAFVVLPMTDLENVPSMPEVTCNNGTNYGKAFDLVRERIDIDVPALIAQGKAVLRPAMFFLTDGMPGDRDWETAFQRLASDGFRRRPHVITYGFGDAREEVLGRVATKAAFLADNAAQEDAAPSRAIGSLVSSLVASARSEEMQIPTEAPGYQSVKVKFIK